LPKPLWRSIAVASYKSRRTGIDAMAYIDTYYRRTIAEDDPRAPLEGEVNAEVCVVGGGLAGLSTALDLARAGCKVVVLEAERVAWGASGRNGGFVGPGYSTSLANIERMVGREQAHTLYRMATEGANIVRGRIEELEIDAAKPVFGKISAIRHDDPDSLKRTQEKMDREFGYRLDFMSREEVRAVLKSKKYHQALFNPQAFHFHPLNYARALGREIERLGGRIFENTPAVGAALDGGEKRVRVAGGTVRAQHVVFAGGGYTTNILPALRRAHLPIATYVLLTEEAPERIADAVACPYAISDARRAGDYYRLVEDGRRILWGGRITTRTTEPRELAQLLRRTMVSTYPQLEGIRIEAAWSGLMSYARHLMPQIGRLREGVWYAQGFGGHGMNTTAIGGRVITEAITGDSDRIRLYEPFGLAWNGGPFGLAAAQLTYWMYQAQDQWRERRR
jgi:gamma-glutamylputrescine oxidase